MKKELLPVLLPTGKDTSRRSIPEPFFWTKSANCLWIRSVFAPHPREWRVFEGGLFQSNAYRCTRSSGHQCGLVCTGGRRQIQTGSVLPPQHGTDYDSTAPGTTRRYLDDF